MGNATGADAVINVLANDTTGDLVDPASFVFDITSSPVSTAISGTPGQSGYQADVPNEGVWSYNGAGELKFTPDAGFTSDPTNIQYTIKDLQAVSSAIPTTSLPATVSVDYNIDAPVAVDDNSLPNQVSTNPVTVDVLANDYDMNAGVLVEDTVSIVGGSDTADVSPNLDRLVVAGEGTWTVDNTTGEITFTPETILGGDSANFTADPTPISYTVADNDGNVSNVATVTIDYAVRAPVAVADFSSENPAGPVMVEPLIDNSNPVLGTYDSDPDGALDATTVSLKTPSIALNTVIDAHGDVTSFDVPNEGNWSVDGTSGDVTFTPIATFNDDPTPVLYNIEDNDGNQSNDASIAIDYLPIATDDVNNVVGVSGSPVIIDVTSNDTDGDLVDIATVDLEPSSPLTMENTLVVAGEGTWSVTTSGVVTFTPLGSYKLDPTAITYTVQDDEENTSNSATITVDYAPIATDDLSTGNAINTAKTVAVLANDTTGDIVDPATVSLVAPVTAINIVTDLNGDITSFEIPGEGTWNVNLTTGAITFDPEPGFITNPTIVSYNVEDDEGNQSNDASVTIQYIQQADIQVTKTDNSDTYTPGTDIVYTITVTNNGPAIATNVVVLDDITNATLEAATSWTGNGITDGDGDLSNTITTLNVGSSVTYTVTIEVPSNWTGTIENTASANSEDIADPDSTNNSSTDTDTEYAISDLSIAKVVDVSSPAVGSTVTFTLIVSNNGPSDASGVKVVDMLPTGFTYTGASGDYNSVTGLWDVGSLPSFSNTALIITATVNASGIYTNSAEITAADQEDPDSIPGNNTPEEDDQDEVTVYPNGVSDLVTTKTVSNSNPNTGDTITYTITVVNNGPSNATLVEVTDVLPTGITYVSHTAIGGSVNTYDDVTGLWNIGNIANGTSVTLTVDALVAAEGTIAQTPITNTITEVSLFETDPSDPAYDGDDLTADIIVTASDLETVKTVSDPTPDEGDTIVYTITVDNNGPSNATGVSLTDLLPAGVTYVSDDAAGAYNHGSGLWTIGGVTTASDSNTTNVIVNGSFEEEVIAENEIPGWEVVNEGDGIFETTTSVGDYSALPTEGDYLFSFYSQGPGYYRLSQAITVPAGNSTLEFDLGYNNEWGGQAPFGQDQYVEVNILDAGSNLINLFTTAPGSDYSSQMQGYSFDLSAYAGQTIRLDIMTSARAVSYGGPIGIVIDNVRLTGTLASGDTATLNITATVDAGTAGQTIINTTTAAAGDQTDPVAEDDLEAPITVNNSLDIVLVKTVDNATPNTGDTITYTVTVTNDGPALATNLIVTDALPAGVSFSTASPSIGTWDAGTGIWTIGDLANGLSESITIDAVVNATGTLAQTPLTNIATHSQDQDDSTEEEPGDDEATADIIVTASDLSTVKTVSNATPNEGDTIKYSIVVKNNGLSDATNVSLVDNLPVGVTYVISATTSGNYNYGSGLWTIGDLANGETAKLTITATVNDGTLGQTITNTTSSVLADQSDPVRGNNAGSVSIVPTAFIDLSLTKIVIDDLIAPEVGDTVTFEVRVENAGPTEATGVQVTDIIPSGYDFVNYSSTIGTYNQTTGLWNIGFIEVGNTAVLLVDVIVLDNGNYDNCAEITAANEVDVDSTPGNGLASEDDFDCAAAPPVQEVDLSIEKTVIADNLTPMVGDEVSFEIRVINNDITEATEVVVTDLLPSGYRFLNYSSTRGTYNYNSGTWNVGKIVEGETEILVIDAIVKATGDYLNCAAISGMHQVDPNTSNNKSCIATTPIPVADLELTKDVDELMPYAETNVDFTMVLTNNGPSDATGVQVMDLLPTGYTFVSYDVTNGSYDFSSGVWDVGTVANNTSETLTVTAYVLPIGDWTNIAEVTASNELDLDSTPGNNDIYEDDQAQVTTEPIVLLTVSEGFSPDGDGINDTFEIEFLGELFPNFSMEIVNRYGNKVYEYTHNGDPYQTPQWWDGYSRGKMNLDNLELPEGTYFYTIYFNNNERIPQTGWVYLRR